MSYEHLTQWSELRHKPALEEDNVSIKTTQRITRERALAILLSEIPILPNGVLEDMLDALADTGQSHQISKFDNFIVSEFTDGA